MSRPRPLRRSLATAAVLGLAAWGTAAPALAEPGNGNGKGNANGHAKHDTKDKDAKDKKDKSGDKGKSEGKSEGKGKPEDKPGKGPKGDHGQGPKDKDKDEGGAGNGDPAGNNGTVKIAPYGEMDGIPQNSPHPGCSFQVEWYGFDEGEDIVSTVSFAMQAPTKDVALTVDGPAEVWVGEDPASGAGTDTGLDGTETYTLSFDGEPHAQQGYHLKLTVATPYSHGNDTKTKVFWVEPCETSTEMTGGTESEEDEEAEVEGAAEGAEGDDTEVLGEQATAEEGEDDTEVMGAQATAPDVAGEEADVPTAVDAGDEANPVLDLVTSPWGALLVVAVGAALTAGALARRRTAPQD